MNVDYASELEKAKQVALAVTCLDNFINDLGCRYEPLILALFRLQNGLMVVEQDDDGSECGVMIGGLHDSIIELSETIAKLQLELAL